MKRRIVWIALAAMAVLLLFGCGETKALHCDRCGKEIKVAVDSNMTEDWIILCEDCQKVLYPDD